MTHDLDDKECFIWRRAFRSPDRAVVRKDLVSAFAMSESSASTLLSSVADRSEGRLEREGYKIVAPVWAQAPHWANEVDLMESLDRGQSRFSRTGLKSSELPVNYSSWSSNLPSAPGALEKIVTAIGKLRPVHIRYVGLKAGDKAKFRRVLPIALERMGDQWRLVAHDLSKSDTQLRTFILSRITGAVNDDCPLSKKSAVIRASPIDQKQRIKVGWHILINQDQKEALKSELGIDAQDTVMVYSRDVHEYLIRYGGRVVSTDVVWPPLVQNSGSK